MIEEKLHFARSYEDDEEEILELDEDVDLGEEDEEEEEEEDGSDKNIE